MAEGAQRADLGQRLEHLAVRQPQVDPGAEVGQRAERAALVARRDDRLDRALADVLDREQAEPDRVALDGELERAAVDVGRQDLDRHPAALGDRGRDLLLVRAEGGQHRGHVLDRVVRLQVGGLVGDQPVAGGVGLVEAVALERLERLEDRVDDVRLDAALGRLGDELLLLGPEHGRLLLADRVAQRVRLGAGEPAEGDGRGHDVLLVDEDPVGLLQVRLEQRVEVGHRLLAVLAPDVGRDVVHRARAGRARPSRRGRRPMSAGGRGRSAACPPTRAGRRRSSRPRRAARTSSRRRAGSRRGRSRCRDWRGRGRPPGAGSSGSRGRGSRT